MREAQDPEENLENRDSQAVTEHRESRVMLEWRVEQGQEEQLAPRVRVVCGAL